MLDSSQMPTHPYFEPVIAPEQQGRASRAMKTAATPKAPYDATGISDLMNRGAEYWQALGEFAASLQTGQDVTGSALRLYGAGMNLTIFGTK